MPGNTIFLDTNGWLALLSASLRDVKQETSSHKHGVPNCSKSQFLG
jgi:hypothetical protein